MSRYLIVGTIFFIVIVVLFFMTPSSSSIEEVEDVKELIEKREEKSLQKDSHSVAIEYEAESSLTQSLVSSSSSASSLSSEIEIIEKLTGEKNLEPLYKEWKQKGDLSYNVYIQKSSESKEEQKLTPPAMPSFTTVEVSGEKIGVVMPSGAKGYIVTKEGGEFSYKEVDSSIESIAPPGIGN